MSRFLTAAVAALAFTSASNAAPFSYWVAENQSSQIYRVDVSTRTAVPVGPANVGIVFGGLGFGQNGTLYMWNTNRGNLYTVNQANGNFTLVGGSNLFGADTFDINPVTNQAVAWSVNGDIHAVNLATGSTTLLVNTTPSNFGIASAFAPDGTYYQLDRNAGVLNRVNLATGAVTLVGSLNLGLDSTNLGFNPEDGFLYAIGISGSTPPLYRIDPTTGAATLLGPVTGLPSNNQVTAGTFQVLAVPEPATLAVFGAVCGLGGLAARRRLKAATA